MKLPISEIRILNHIRYDTGLIQALAENIAEFGLLHPLVVNEHYELIAGFRRLKAVELLGWTEVPVTIISPTNELKKLDTSLHENFRRKDLNPLEVCEAILERKHRWEKLYGPIKPGPKSHKVESENELLAQCEKFIQETAKILQTSESTIHRLLQLKELDADIKQQLEERKISYRTALSLQSERKKEQKLKPKSKLYSPNLPDRNIVVGLQEEYTRSPVLFKIIIAVSHLFQLMQQTQGNLPAFDKANPERLVHLVGQIS
ncbi:MAG: ParB/RepB/Spo0J family partition protein, partial [bacterium]|nr:ParB/RepB/Spo0J family partition protein [bacterium]